MTRWAPQQADTLAALAAEILHNYSRGRNVVAVDGLAGSGAHAFADALSGAIADTGHEVHRASADVQVDDAAFRSTVIEPFRAGGTAGGEAAPALLVVDGVMLQRPTLRGAFAFTVWLEVPSRADDTTAAARYLAEVAPRTRASAIVDTTDIHAPRRVFADSC